MRGPCVSSLDCSLAQPIMPSWAATIVMAAPPRKRRRSRVILSLPRVDVLCDCFLVPPRSKPSLCRSPPLCYLCPTPESTRGAWQERCGELHRVPGEANAENLFFKVLGRTLIKEPR